ncbi:MAG: hypothetical protein JXB49_26675 [Bacteroidales bacterium]|nr:hypothetical protein [Bacteroidales bacterium]
MVQKKNIEVIISDQPKSQLINREFITRTQRQKLHRDIANLIKDTNANFHGRAWNKTNGHVYEIFTVDDKRILVEDPDATVMLKSLFDTDGLLREVSVK